MKFLLVLMLLISSLDVLAVRMTCDIIFVGNSISQNYTVPLINKASKSLYLYSYTLTEASVVNALIIAKKRNVDVRVILNKGSMARGGILSKLVASDINVLIDNKSNLNTDRYIVVDHFTVQTDNSICASVELAVRYEQNWGERYINSRPLVPR